LAAANELADQLESISADEKKNLKQDIEDLVRKSPRTEPAKARLKHTLKKVGREGGEMLKGALTDLLSETLNKTIFGGP
jgi:hypothetical protein